MTVSVTAKSRTLSNGTANDAVPVEANFTELYNNDNALATAHNVVQGTTSTNSAVDGKFLVLRNAFASSPSDNCGVEVERGSSPNVQVRYNETTDTWQLTNDGTVYNNIPAGYLIGYQGTAAPVYASASTLTIAYIRAQDSTNAVAITKATSTTVDITVSGAGGLQTGLSEAADTWYSLYAISKADGTTSAMLSTTNEAVTGTITLPTDYLYKRQLPFVVRNDGSSNFLPFRIVSGWPFMPTVEYDSFTTAAPYQVLNAGTSTTYAGLSCVNIVPPGTTEVGLVSSAGGNITVSLRATGTARDNVSQSMNSGWGGIFPAVPVNASQSFDYKVNTSNVSLYIYRYTLGGIG